MTPDLIKRIARLTVLAAAVVVSTHILIDDGRSNWLVLIPGTIVASAVYHFSRTSLAVRRVKGAV